MQELIPELQAQRIGLEVLKEELRASEMRAEMASRYFELYDQAPVADGCLNAEGIIEEANLFCGIAGQRKNTAVPIPVWGIHPISKNLLIRDNTNDIS